jgi:F5/8 type C domain
MNITHGRLLAAFGCAALSSCLISPKNYPVGDIAADGGATDAGEGGGSTGGQTEPSVGGATMGGAATGGTAGAPLTTAACDRSTWTATAFAFTATVGYGDGTPSQVLDGSDQTRWTSGVPQAPGQWLQVDLGTPSRLVGLQLRCVQFPDDQPIAVTLEIDGASVDATSTIVGPAIELAFAPVLVHSARIVLLTPSTTMVAPMSPSWWSMDELDGTCITGDGGGTGDGGNAAMGGGPTTAQGGAGPGNSGPGNCIIVGQDLDCARVCTNSQTDCQAVINCFVQHNSSDIANCMQFTSQGISLAQSAEMACCP